MSVKTVSTLIKDGNMEEAIKLLRTLASPTDNLINQSQYAALAQKIIKNSPALPVVRIAFLANVTLQHWVDSLRFWMLLEGYQLESYIAPFGAWNQEVLDTNSELYSFKPDIVWFFFHQADLRLNESSLYQEDLAIEVLSQLARNIADQVALVADNTSAISIVNNIVPPSGRVFGNLEGSIDTSPAALIQRYNLEFPKVLVKSAVVFDIAHIASTLGLDNWHDARLWHHSKHPFSFNVQAEVAFSAARLLKTIKGGAKKCLVLDLDNTLWGGVVGDDGVDGILIGSNSGAIGEAYSSFQRWIKSLANRGIALAVCSKNDQALAKEPFTKSNGMVLMLSDFASFHANWRNKADNIRAIAEEMNLGLDSLVFVDDNPAERELVRRELPQVAVPELPVDPSGYIQAIVLGKWFETLGISKEDTLRVQAYKENSSRRVAQSRSTDLSSYLESLKMKVVCEEVDSRTLLRATQLINKTNQFNMTTARYSEAQIAAFLKSPSHWVGCYSLKDRFGDFGNVSIVVIKYDGDVAVIDTWVMSCRVFSRGLEDFIFYSLWMLVKQHGQKKIVGKYIPSAKNKVIENLYARFGGTKRVTSKAEYQWYFDLEDPIQVERSYFNENEETK